MKFLTQKFLSERKELEKAILEKLNQPEIKQDTSKEKYQEYLDQKKKDLDIIHLSYTNWCRAQEMNGEQIGQRVEKYAAKKDYSLIQNIEDKKIFGLPIINISRGEFNKLKTRYIK